MHTQSILGRMAVKYNLRIMYVISISRDESVCIIPLNLVNFNDTDNFVLLVGLILRTFASGFLRYNNQSKVRVCSG